MPLPEESVTLPILFSLSSVNHRFPSAPSAISTGETPAGVEYSVIVPAVVILAIFPASSVNHKLPSGPQVMPSGTLFAVGIEYSVTTPVVVIFATL